MSIEHKDNGVIELSTETKTDIDSSQEEETKSVYRTSSKSVYITYPQCSLSPHDVLKHLQKLSNYYVLKLYYIATEDHHETHGKHIHAYYEYNKKQNILNSVKYYTITHEGKDYVPHFEKVRNGTGNKNNIIAYITKDGNFITNYKPSVSTSLNYLRNQADYQAWQRDLEVKTRVPNEYPITYYGFNITKPNPANKRRHLWVVGCPDVGKSHKLGILLQGVSYYYRKNDDRNFFESYNQEELVVYDDIYGITFSEITATTQVYMNDQTTVFGGSRYRPNYYKSGVCRTMIVISNDFPNYFGTTHGTDNSQAFASRFNVLMLSHKKDNEGRFNLDVIDIPQTHLSDEKKMNDVYRAIYNKRRDEYDKHIRNSSVDTNPELISSLLSELGR